MASRSLRSAKTSNQYLTGGKVSTRTINIFKSFKNFNIKSDLGLKVT